MDELRRRLAPLTDWLPAGMRSALPAEGWWAIFAGVALMVLIVFWLLLRALFRRRLPQQAAAHAEEVEDLGRYPPLKRPPGANIATVYHVPCRLRLAIVAPVGKQPIAVDDVEAMLDRIVPGLGQVARDDKPRVVVWPPQLSHHGFGATFHRTTLKPEEEGQPSHWVLVAGRATVGKQPIALGLALWSDQPNSVGRLSLEMNQWLDVLRLKPSR